MAKEDFRMQLLKRLPPKSIGAEIGVHKGDFSNLILEVVNPSALYLIDPWNHEEDELYSNSWYGGLSSGQKELDDRFESVCRRFADEVGKEIVFVHRKNSKDALEEFQPNYLDWVYIDGNHLYDYVMQDLKLSFDKVKHGGMICGDDYQLGGWWEGGVKDAVDEFCEKNNLNVEVLGNQFIIFK